MDHDMRRAVFNIIRALLDDLGPTAAGMPSVKRANEFLVRLLPVAEPVDAPREYVVYLLGKSGAKKYDPIKFGYIGSSFKQDAPRMTEDEARKRVAELGSTYPGCGMFRYEKA